MVGADQGTPTPELLILVDAPTQTWKYVSESSTSRKELPVVFARKRKRTSAELDEGDILAAPPSVNELSAIEARRRQNTLAARRTRKCKLEHQRGLESVVDNERAEKDAWKQRALAFEEATGSASLRNLRSSVCRAWIIQIPLSSDLPMLLLLLFRTPEQCYEFRSLHFILSFCTLCLRCWRMSGWTSWTRRRSSGGRD